MNQFKINTSSFKTRLLFSFVMAGLVTLILVVVTIAQMVSIVSLENDIVQTLQPTQVYLQRLKAAVQESMYVASTNFEDDKIIRRATWNDVWDSKIQANLDSVRVLQTQWNSIKASEDHQKLESTVLDMKPLQNDCMVFMNRSERFGLPLGEEYALAKKRLLNLYEETNTLIALLMDAQRVRVLEDQDLVEKELRQFQTTELILLFIAFSAGIIVAYIVAQGILTQIRQTRDTITVLGSGNLPQKVPQFNNELREIVNSIEVLVENFRKLKQFAQQVGKGEYDNTPSVFEKQGELGLALEEMRSSLQHVSDKESKRAWQNKGITKFVEILRNNNDDLRVLGDKVIQSLTQYLNCNQGGIYIVNNTEETFPALNLIAYYAFEKKKFIRQTFDSREGLIGQAYKEQKLIHLTEIPEDYGFITSGVGGARPKTVIIAPLKVNDIMFGVIELASFSYFEEYQIEFIEKLAENIAATFSNVQMNIRTRKLLETSQQQAEQVRAQEEEMRQNVEELQATQEEMRRKASMLEVSEARNKAFFDGAVNPIIFLNAQGEIEDMNSSGELLFDKKLNLVRGKPFNEFVTIDYTLAIGQMQAADAVTAKGKVNIEFYVRESIIGKETFYIAYLRDVTNANKEREAMENRQAEMERSIKDLTHELAAENKKQEKMLAEHSNQHQQEVSQLQAYIMQWKAKLGFTEAIIDNIPTAVAWKDASLNFIGANTSFLHLAGIVSKEYLLGQNHHAMPWADMAEEYQTIEKEVWLSGKSVTKEMNHTDGGAPEQFEWIPLKNQANEVIAILLVHQKKLETVTEENVKQREVYEEYLREVEKVKRAIRTILD